MIQDIFPTVFDNHYEPKEPDASAVLMFVRGDEVLYRTEKEKIIYPRYVDCIVDGVDSRYILSMDETGYFLACETAYYEDEEAHTAYMRLVRALEEEGFSFRNRMTLRSKSDKEACFAGATAWQIGSWYADNRICGRCGHPLQHAPKERMMKCPRCGNQIYPKICPAVIVAVMDRDRLLLTKYAAGYSHYALVAGFAEAGETIEETVRREVMEEVGLRVKNLRYYKSQPWTFTDTLLFGFFCEADKDTEITLDTTELASAAWLTREELEEVKDDGISLTREMIRMFREGKAGTAPAPAEREEGA